MYLFMLEHKHLSFFGIPSYKLMNTTDSHICVI